VAWLHFRIGILRNYIGQRLEGEPREDAAYLVGEQVRLAMAEFDRAEELYQAARDTAGRAEVILAKADIVRMLGGSDSYQEATILNGRAWSFLTQEPGIQAALGSERWAALLRQVWLSMGELDRKELDATHHGLSLGQVRANAIFLRPLSSTREVWLQPPVGYQGSGVTPAEHGVTLEVALSRALNPVVDIFYVGGALHPGAMASGTSTGSEVWRDAVQLSLEDGDIVILVPGVTPGMRWELEYVIVRGHLDRCLLSMMPLIPGFPSQELWEKSRNLAAAKGLTLPPYSTSGAFFRLNNKGRLVRRLSFDALWEEGKLLMELEDLLSTPEEMQRRHEDAMQNMANFERQGTLTRFSQNPRSYEE
jgi:hypothetical protein